MPTVCGQPTAVGFNQSLLQPFAATMFPLFRLVRGPISLPGLLEAVFKGVDAFAAWYSDWKEVLGYG